MENKFINGDCMHPEYGLPSYPDKFFDLAVVDPPYGIGYDKAQNKQALNRIAANGKTKAGRG